MDQLDVETFVIDMSNVCWDRSLPPVDSLRPTTLRFTRTIRALANAKPRADVVVVADNSLRHSVADTARQWRELCARYRIKEVPVADDLVLSIAAESPKTAVVSRDQFLDHRKQHPWIPSRAEYFFKPVHRSGDIGFVPSGIRFVAHHAVSRMIEVKQLRRLGIDVASHRSILETQWRCVNHDCFHCRLWEVLLLWPEVDPQGGARCPTCTAPLEAVGRRPTACEVIGFSVKSGEELVRFPVEAGRPVVVGRGALRTGVSLDALCSRTVDTDRISRQHLLIELFDDGRVQITDLASSNGTSIRRAGSTVLTTVEPHSPATLGRHDSVNLGRTVRLELSGQRFIPNPSQMPPSDQPAGETKIELQ